MNSTILTPLVCGKFSRGLFRVALLSVGCLLVSFGGILRGDILVDGYTPATNDRFTNSGSFIGSSFNLSGVGQMTGSDAWGTAISRNVIVSAAHAPPFNSAPGANNSIHFYANNDPTSSPVIRTVISGLKVPGTDLYLAVLDSNLPESIVHYSFATEALSGPVGSVVNAGIYQNLNAYMFGRRAQGGVVNPRFQDQAVGRNRITGYVENVNFLGNPDNDSLVLFYDTSSSPNYVQYESFLSGGDSGAPLFVDNGGQLRLLGTNAFNNNSPQLSGINYTGNQAAFITSYINAVPEPSSLLVLAVCQIAALLPRRRKLL